MCNVATGRKRQTIDHPDWVNAVAFAPDGNTLVTGDNSGRIRLWDATTAIELSQFGDQPDKVGEPPSVTSLAFLPDGKTLAVASIWDGRGDASLRLWDVGTGTIRRRSKGTPASLRGLPSHPTARRWQPRAPMERRSSGTWRRSISDPRLLGAISRRTSG